MVTILSPALTSPTRIEHERITSPLMCTEQAPHWAMPQPYLVPVRPTCSRITHKSGVSGSTSTSCTRPLILSLAMSVLSRLEFECDCWNSGYGSGDGRMPDGRSLPDARQHSPYRDRLPTGIAVRARNWEADRGAEKMAGNRRGGQSFSIPVG